AARLELLRGGLHGRHVALGAHHDADARGVDVHVVELLLDLGEQVGLRHAAMSSRRWDPGNSIMSAAAYAAVRAAARSSPSAVTPRTRPPAVTTAAPSSAVPAWN